MRRLVDRLVIWHVARRELIEHVRSARFLALCGLATLLLPLSAHVNAAHFRTRLAQVADLQSAAQRKAAEHIRESGAYETLYGWRDGDVIADAALRAVRPPARLAVLAMGADAALPAYWQFSTEGVEPGPNARSSDSRTDAHGSMDAVFVVQAVLGLLALLLVFDGVSGERDSGVLRLVLAAPVRRADLLLGKALGASCTLTIPLLIGLAVALVILEIESVSLLDRRSAVPLSIFCAASALYLVNMVGLGLAVSATARRAKNAWVLVLLAWIGFVMVIPRTAELLAAVVHPVIPSFDARQAKAQAIQQLQRERAQLLSAAWRRLSGVDSAPSGRIDPSLRGAYARAIATDEARLLSRKRAAIREIDGRRQRARERQRTLANAIARLSPAASYGLLAADIAGTGDHSAERWRDQVAAHQARLEAATFDRPFGMELFPRQLGYLRITWWPDLGDPNDRPPAYRDLPAFAYQEPATASVARRVLPDLAVLLGGSIGWLTVALIAFQRLDVQ